MEQIVVDNIWVCTCVLYEHHTLLCTLTRDRESVEREREREEFVSWPSSSVCDVKYFVFSFYGLLFVSSKFLK